MQRTVHHSMRPRDLRASSLGTHSASYLGYLCHVVRRLHISGKRPLAEEAGDRRVDDNG